MTLKELDYNKIRAVALLNETSKEFFKMCQLRERFIADMNLRRTSQELVRSGIKFVKKDFYETMRELAKLGLGSLTEHNNTPLFFKWHTNFIKIAEEVMPKIPKTSKVVKSANISNPFPMKATLTVIKDDDRKTTVYFGGDRRAQVVIPIKTSKEEIKFLCEVLLSGAS